MILPDFSGWTLFLDRDGVINERLPGAYVSSIQEFVFTVGATHAIAEFAKVFTRIIVVTNQQGIGKGLMTENALLEIHRHMIQDIEKSGGRIDKVLYCPHLKESRHFCRKPNIGMALEAKKFFPEISFRRSVMIGDSISDMQFGKRLGMFNVFIDADVSMARTHAKLINLKAQSLAEAARLLLLPKN
jgi:histidinol-phosphate phosphatase family protein